jgi:hypothetical protein
MTRALLGRLLRTTGRCGPLAARGRLPADVEQVIVVIAEPNPSFDYYLAPRLSDASSRCRIVSLWSPPQAALASPEADGALVVFCRYVSRAWLDAVEARRERLAGVALFVDDDFEAVLDDSTAPLGYRLQLAHRHLVHRAQLARLLDALFVSTVVLAARHAAAGPIVLCPVPSRDDRPAPRDRRSALRVCFHTTGAHAAEHAWLVPVLARLAHMRPDVEIEIVATPSLASIWRRVPRARFAGTMSWPLYRDVTRRRGCDVLLAPLLDTIANRARAPTKRIDAYRMGAALLTNAADVYRPGSDELDSGMLLPLCPDAWADGLARLIDDRARIASLAALNARHVEAWPVAGRLV